MRARSPSIPLAAIGIGGLSSFFTFSSLGSAVGRTLALAPVLWGRPQPASRAVALATLAGAIAAALLLGLLVLVGADHLPNWMKVPPAIVFVQGVYGWLMGLLMPNSYEPSIDLSAGELAFALYGIITLPATALFILAMTVGSFLS
jgi:hypothetical protein